MPVTALLAVALIAGGRPIAGTVWFAFGVLGTLVAIRVRRPQPWPFWALLGVVAAVAGSFGLPPGTVGGVFVPGSTVDQFSPANALAGTVIALALTVTALLGAARLASSDAPPLETAIRLAGSLAGAGGPWWVVRDGRLIAQGPHVAGGSLEVPDDWVVVTSIGGAFSRVVGPEGHPSPLGDREVPRRAIPLQPQTSTGQLEGALTRDAVRLPRLEWSAEWRLRADPDAADTGAGPYPFDPQAAKQAAWGPEDLASAVSELVGDALVEAFRSHPMTDLFDPAGEAIPLSAAVDDAGRRLAASLDLWGLSFLGLRVPSVELAEDVQEHLHAVWHAKIDRQVRALHRQAEEDAHRARKLRDFAESLPEGESAAESPDRATATAAATADASASRHEDASASRPQDASASRPLDSTATRMPDGSESRPRGGSASPPGRPSSGAEDASSRTPEEVRTLAAALSRARSRGRTGRAGGEGNPVSFTQFLRTLRERAAKGDESAATVLKQVMDAMSRLDPPADGASDEDADNAQGRLL